MPEADQQTNSSSSSQGSQQQSGQAAAQDGAAAQSSAQDQNKGGDQGQQQSGQQQQQAATRPEGIPETYWDKTANALKVDPAILATDLKERDELKAFKAAEDSRKLTIPKPEAYAVELPKDFKAPEGVNFELNKDDPIIAQARTIANKRGLDQEGFSEFLGLYAATKVGEQQQFATAKAAEIAKLGVNATPRVTAVTTWLNAMGGAEAAPLIRALEMAPVAGTVVAFENLMKKFTSQGGANFSQSHRATEDEAKIPGYDTMSFEQKRNAQDQRARVGAR